MIKPYHLLLGLAGASILSTAPLAVPQTLDQIQTPVDTAYWIAKDERNQSDRIQQLRQVGIRYSQQGDLESVTQVAELIRRQSPPSVMIKISSDFSVALINGTNTQQSVSYLQKLGDPNEKNAAIESLVAALIQKNQLEKALDIAQQLSNPARRNRLILDVVTALANAGNTEKAMAASNLITGPSKNDGLYAISAAYAEQKEFARATDIAREISDITLQQKAQVKLLSERAKSKDLEGIQQSVRQLGSPSAQQRALQYVAMAYLSDNRFADAQSILDSIGFTDIREAVLAAMAKQYAINREFELAEKSLEQINLGNRGAAAFEVAKAMTDDDNVDRAFELVNALEPSDRAVYLPKLAAAFGRSPQVLFTQLLIKQIDPIGLKNESTEQFLVAMADTNTPPEKVIRYARDIKDVELKDQILVKIASVYLKKKAYNSASDTIQAIHSPVIRIEHESRLASELNQSDGLARLQRAELLLPNLPVATRAASYTHLALAHFQLGRAEKAQQLIKLAAEISLNTPDVQWPVIASVITTYGQMGMANNALQYIRNIPARMRVQALLVVTAWPTTDEIQSVTREIARDKK